MMPHEKQKLIKALETIRKFVDDIPMEKACWTCEHHHNIRYCGLHPDEAIPDDVLKKGCPSYVFDPDSPPF